MGLGEAVIKERPSSLGGLAIPQKGILGFDLLGDVGKYWDERGILYHPIYI